LKRRIRFWGYVLAAAAFLAAGTASADTFLQYGSQLGDNVGETHSGVLSSPTTVFTARLDSATAVSLDVRGPGDAHWTLDFAAPPGATLAPGTYTNALRYLSNGAGVPGLNVASDLGGCSDLYGSFTVLELVVGAGNVVTSFAADFVQHCLGYEPALYGGIRFNSNVPYTPAVPQPAGPGFITLASSAGDYVGGGITRTVDRSTGWFHVYKNTGGGVSVAWMGVPDFWFMDFAPPPGLGFGPGTYELAQRYPYNTSGHPGLAVYGDGRGCNEDTGRFTVLEIQYGPDNTVAKLAVDFEQHCEGAASTLFGGIRFNSAIAYVVPPLPVATSIARVSAAKYAVRQQSSGDAVQVIVLDQNGQPFERATVRFTVVTACGSFMGASSASVTSDATGVATGPAFDGGSVSGNCTVEASLEGPISAPPVDTVFIVYSPADVVQTPLPSSSITVGVGRLFQAGLRVSILGQTLANLPVYFLPTAGSAAPALLTQVSMTDSTGTAYSSGLAGATVGTYGINIGGPGGMVTISVNQVADSGAPTPPPPPIVFIPPITNDVQDMWWVGSSENGWGMSLIQHDDTLFGALYIYDANGKPTWLVMPGGTWDSKHVTYTGALYTPNGSPFYAYDTTRFVAGAEKGSIKIAFQDVNNAILTYTIAGVTASKVVTREIFAGGSTVSPDRSDLWWGGSSQNGWGITVLQQGSTLFAVWYTYDANGVATWYVMPGGTWTATDTYEGHLYRTTGSPWLGAPYNPSSLQVFDAGTFSFKFTGDNAIFSYTVDGHTGTNSLVREPF
jgi:hypothetical protein